MGPDEWDKLTLEQRKSSTDAWYGLMDGDLTPLARHIRKGWPVDEGLAATLADMIEGREEIGYRLECRGMARNQKSFSDQDAAHKRQWDIALFVWKRQSELGEGSFESAVAEACTRFGVERSTVTASITKSKKALSSKD